jgi:hypothetical protein
MEKFIDARLNYPQAQRGNEQQEKSAAENHETRIFVIK